MKNIFTTILSGLALASLLVSCQKEMDTTTTVPVGEMVPVTFSAKVGAVTKVSLTPNVDDTSFTSAWEDGDGMKIYYLNDQLDEDTVDATYDEANSKWNATLPSYNGEWNYVASYPAASAIPFGAARTQSGNAYNPAYDIMQGEVNVTSGNPGKDDEGNDIVFPMERLTAIQYFHFTSDLDEKVYSATLSVGNTDSDIAATTVNISAGSLVVATGGSKSITITFPDGLEPNASDFKLWFNVLPAFFESMTIDIETASHTKHIERAIGGGIGEYEVGKLYKVSGKITGWTTKVKGSEYTWTTKSGDLGTSETPSTSVSVGSPSLTWSSAFTWKSSNYLGWDGSGRGIQIGSGSNPAKKLVLSTTNYTQYVSSIKINASRAGTAGPQISSVTVNGINLKYSTETSVDLSATATDYIFESPYLLKGDIVITLENSAGVAMYLKSISINSNDIYLTTSPTNGQTIEWDDDESGSSCAETITVSQNYGATGYTVSYTDAGDKWTVSDDTAGTITVYPNDDNDSASVDKTLTVTITHKDDGDVKSVVTLKQKKVPSAYSTTYTTSSNCSVTSNAAQKVVINSTQYDCAKANKGGSFTITIPANTTRVHLFIAAWNGEASTVTVTGGTMSDTSITADTGVSSSSPYTLAGTIANYYRTITPTNSSTTEITISLQSGKRAVVWGVNEE